MCGSERMMHAQRLETIREQNDAFRRDLCSSQILPSSGILTLIGDDIEGLIIAISDFDDFTGHHRSYSERDFGHLSWFGKPIFWKIYYLDAGPSLYSPDPADPDQTIRVLMVMLASEF